MTTCFIIIDCWSTTDTEIVQNICKRIASDPCAVIINANHGGDHGDNLTHPLLQQALDNCANTVYHSHDQTAWLLRILSIHSIVKVAVMGSHWPACTHHSAYGVRALIVIRTYHQPIGIIMYPDCVELYQSATSTERTLTHTALIQTGWQPCGDFYLYS